MSDIPDWPHGYRTDPVVNNRTASWCLCGWRGRTAHMNSDGTYPAEVHEEWRAHLDVNAVRQFLGEIDTELELWLGPMFESWLPSKRQLVIRTSSGERTISEGDWIHKATHMETK